MNTDHFAIFLDIDNTLMYNGILPEKNITAIKKAREKGNYVFVNTGRSYAFIPDIVKDSSLFDGFVAGIGTDLRLDGKQIYSNPLSNSELKFIAELFINDSREISFEGEDAMIWINPHKDRENIVHLLSSPNDFDTKYKDFKISKMYVHGKLSQEVNDILSKDYIVFQHENYAEFVKKGHSKSIGMKIMADKLNIPISNCIAMGDSSNDLDMLMQAGISVAMGNSIEQIKNISTYISCNAEDGGVAQAIEKFVL